jgi:spore coat protein U-like protein
MGVSLTITAGCLTTATPLAFGSTSVLAASIYQQSTVNVTCTNLTPYDIGLDPGANFATTRNMKSAGAALVSYKLWRESAHSSAWGTAVGTDTVSGIGSGVLIATTVYGEVTAQTSPIPAIYADIVNVTVTF